MRSKSKSPKKLSDLLAIPRSQTCDLSHQLLTRIPASTFKTNEIKKLCLNNNKLSDLTNIETYQSLKELDLSNNNIKSWKHLKKVSRFLQVLTVEANPLENEPNYLYNIVLLFPSIKKVNRTLMNEELRKNTIEQQMGISSGLLNWMVELNRMGQRLTRAFSEFLRVESISDYNEAIEILEAQQESLTSQLAPLHKFRNESMFVKTRVLYQLLSQQQEISFDSSEREAVEENFFEYLISYIAKTDRRIAEFLTSEITIKDHDAENELIGNEALMFKKMYYHFKKHWIEQYEKEGEEEENVFPYYPFEEVFVESVYESFITILEANLKKIQQSLDNVEKSEVVLSPSCLPLSLPSQFPVSRPPNQNRQNRTTMYIGDGEFPSIRVTQSRIRSLKVSDLIETVPNQNPYHLNCKWFCKTLFRVIQNKKKRHFLKLLHKSTKLIKILDKKFYVLRELDNILRKHLEPAFQKLITCNIEYSVIEIHHRNRYLKSTVLHCFKELMFYKYLKLEKLQNLISKKERATKLIKAYSFKRWKLLSSKTLKYIREVKRSLDRKEETLNEQYKKIVTERLGTKRRSSVFVRGYAG